jgi:hypothetical protein
MERMKPPTIQDVLVNHNERIASLEQKMLYSAYVMAGGFGASMIIVIVWLIVG